MRSTFMPEIDSNSLMRSNRYTSVCSRRERLVSGCFFFLGMAQNLYRNGTAVFVGYLVALFFRQVPCGAEARSPVCGDGILCRKYGFRHKCPMLNLFFLHGLLGCPSGDGPLFVPIRALEKNTILIYLRPLFRCIVSISFRCTA